LLFFHFWKKQRFIRMPLKREMMAGCSTKGHRALIAFFPCGGTGVSIQGFTLAKQVLYNLSHTFSPFCSG
jgi:hypothetical protein